MKDIHIGSRRRVLFSSFFLIYREDAATYRQPEQSYDANFRKETIKSHRDIISHYDPLTSSHSYSLPLNPPYLSYLHVPYSYCKIRKLKTIQTGTHRAQIYARQCLHHSLKYAAAACAVDDPSLEETIPGYVQPAAR